MIKLDIEHISPSAYVDVEIYWFTIKTRAYDNRQAKIKKTSLPPFFMIMNQTFHFYLLWLLNVQDLFRDYNDQHEEFSLVIKVTTSLLKETQNFLGHNFPFIEILTWQNGKIWSFFRGDTYNYSQSNCRHRSVCLILFCGPQP